MLTKLGVGVGVAWAAPVILSTPAFAQGTPCASPESINWSSIQTDLDTLETNIVAVAASTNRQVTLTYVDSLNVGSTGDIQYGSGTQGGQTGNFIEMILDGTPGPGEYIAINFDFDAPVNQLNFVLLDLDAENGAWEDGVRVTAYSDFVGGTQVAISATDYTIVNNGVVLDALTAGGVDFTTLPPQVNNGLTDGNVQFHFTGTVQAVAVEYHAVGPDRQLQQIGIGPFSFCI